MTDLTREQLEAMLEAEDDLMLVGTHDIARQLLATMTALAEAQAAQAMVIEQVEKAIRATVLRLGNHPDIRRIMAPQVMWGAGDSCISAIRSLADPTGVKLLAELRRSNEAFQRNGRETFEAMCTMRDAINEHLPLPSLESDLLQGPENSVFCATVAENVIAGLTEMQAEIEALKTERDEAQAAQALVVERACLAVSEQADWPEDEHGRTEQPELFARVINAIRSLADPTGVKMLADLRARAERAEAELQRFHEERAYVIGANDGWDAAVEQGEASPAVSKAMVRFWKKLAETHNSRAERAEAERDRLAAANAALEAKVAKLVEALTLIERVYYLEEKDATWKIARMNGIARDAQDGNDLGQYRRIFPRATLAEVQAAQAVAVERAAEMAAEIHSSLAAAIRSLADPTGVKLLAELRAERDHLLTITADQNAWVDRAKAAEAQLAEAQKREAGYQEALIWCSGSDDFQADGKARAGWLKLCAPLIDRAALSAAPTGEESNG